MLTIVTNVLGVFILPFTVPLVISQAQSVSLDPVSLLVKLVMTILVPLIIGKILRESSQWIRNQVTKHKVALGLLNNGSLICIVWQTLSSAQEDVVNTAFGILCLVLLAAILLHVVYLVVNFILVKLFRFPHREAAAVLIMGSEKTLPMAVTVIAATGTALGSTGQLTVPCVLAHISQVLIDAFLCDYLGKREHRKILQAIPIARSGSIELEDGNSSSGKRPATVEVVVGPVSSNSEVVLGSAKSSASKLAPSSDDNSPTTSTMPAESNV